MWEARNGDKDLCIWFDMDLNKTRKLSAREVLLEASGEIRSERKVLRAGELYVEVNSLKWERKREREKAREVCVVSIFFLHDRDYMSCIWIG